MDFILSFPLHAVVQDVGLLVREPLSSISRNDGAVAVAVFTEELHAERAMQSQRPGGYLIEINDSQELESFLTQSHRLIGATRVTLDPYAESGRQSIAYSIEDAIESIRGDC